jgi:hypothetical protein
MTDHIIGYRAECAQCEGFSFAESQAFVDNWATKHKAAHPTHVVNIVSTREYQGAAVHHTQVAPKTP